MSKNKNIPAHDHERDRSFPVIGPTGDEVPFLDPTSVPKEELIKEPPVGDEDHDTQ